MLLIQGSPVAGANGMFDSHQLLKRVALRVQSLSSSPHKLPIPVFVLLRDGGKVDGVPLVAFASTGRFEKAACKVISTPTSLNNNDATAGSESGVQSGRIPIPDILPDGRAVSRHAVFHWVINQSDVCAHSRDATANTCRAVDALVIHYLEDVRVAQVGTLSCRPDGLSIQGRFRKDLVIHLVLNNALDVAVVSAGEVSAVRGGDDGHIRVATEHISGEAAGSYLRLARTRRTGQHEPRGASGNHVIEKLVQLSADAFMEPPHLIVGDHELDEGTQVNSGESNLQVLQ